MMLFAVDISVHTLQTPSLESTTHIFLQQLEAAAVHSMLHHVTALVTLL